jgi:hypothetical protein
MSGPRVNKLGIRQGLGRHHFQKIAERGFGDGHNSYTHSMTWFNGRLYVSTMRDNFALMRSRLSLGIDVWPVECPKDPFDLDLRAEIWSYDPKSHLWERVFKAPMITGSHGKQIPRAAAGAR